MWCTRLGDQSRHEVRASLPSASVVQPRSAASLAITFSLGPGGQVAIYYWSGDGVGLDDVVRTAAAGSTRPSRRRPLERTPACFVENEPTPWPYRRCSQTLSRGNVVLYRRPRPTSARKHAAYR